MTIPLFGFGNTTPKANVANHPRRVSFGDAFLSTFGPAMESSAERWHQSQEGELDRAFEEAQQDRRLIAQSRENDITRRYERDLLVQGGEIIPATPDNVEYLRRRLPDDEIESAVFENEQGERFIHKPVWDAASEGLVSRMETQTPIGREIATLPQRVLGDNYALSDETVAGATDEDGNGYVSQEALDRFNTELGIVFGVAELHNDRLAQLARGTNKGRSADIKDYNEALEKTMMLTIYGPDGTELRGRAKAEVASVAAQLQTGVYLDPHIAENHLGYAGELDAGYTFSEPLDAEAVKEQMRTSIAIPSEGDTAAGIWMGITGGRAFDRGINKENAAEIFNTNDISPDNPQIIYMVRQSPPIRSALYLMANYENAEQLERFFASMPGGYNKFRDLINEETISMLKQLSPERFGEFDIAAANRVISATPGTGTTSSPVDNPNRRDTVGPRDAREEDEDEDQPPQADMFDTMSAVWENRMRIDGSYGAEVEQFILEVSDPETGPERFVNEMLDVARRSYTQGDFTDEDLRAAETFINAWKYIAESDRENFVRIVVPQLQAALETAMLNIDRRPVGS